MAKPKSSVPALKPSETQPLTPSQNLSGEAERVFVQLECLHAEEQLRGFGRHYRSLSAELVKVAVGPSLSPLAWREVALSSAKRYRKDARDLVKLARRLGAVCRLLRPKS